VLLLLERRMAGTPVDEPTGVHDIACSEEAGGYSARVSDEPDDPAWDDFLERSPIRHHAQTSAWGRARASIGWRPIRVVVSRNGRIVGGVQMVTRPMPLGGSVGFVHRGPIVGDDPPELVALVLDEMLAMGASRDVAYLVVQPPPGAHWLCPEMTRRGFRYGAFDIDHTATMRLDLRQDVDDLFARMSSKRRQHVRSAEKQGVIVRQGSESDLPIFNRLKDAHSARLGYARRQGAYYEELWRALGPRGHIGLFIAEIEGEPVSALLVIPFGDICRHMERPWSGERSELRANELLEWEAIKWAKAQGYRSTDLEGIDPPLAHAIVAGTPIEDDPKYSASMFKLKFGGDIVIDPPSYDYFYNPALRLAYRCVPTRVTRSAWMRRILFSFRQTGS
jgi:lipid II:glycine glycyltransferase (peptidoglycan interpeptide bridge formation enzyme)